MPEQLGTPGCSSGRGEAASQRLPLRTRILSGDAGQCAPCSSPAGAALLRINGPWASPPARNGTGAARGGSRPRLGAGRGPGREGPRGWGGGEGRRGQQGPEGRRDRAHSSVPLPRSGAGPRWACSWTTSARRCSSGTRCPSPSTSSVKVGGGGRPSARRWVAGGSGGLCGNEGRAGQRRGGALSLPSAPLPRDERGPAAGAEQRRWAALAALPALPLPTSRGRSEPEHNALLPLLCWRRRERAPPDLLLPDEPQRHDGEDQGDHCRRDDDRRQRRVSVAPWVLSPEVVASALPRCPSSGVTRREGWHVLATSLS